MKEKRRREKKKKKKRERKKRGVNEWTLLSMAGISSAFCLYPFSGKQAPQAS